MSGLDLYLAQRTLALMFVYAVLTGFGLGLVYDGFRILRMALGDSTAASSPARRRENASELRSPRRRAPVLTAFLFVEDLVFMLIAAVALIILGYYTNDGQLRAPAPLGMACGFFVYIHTVSRPLIRLAALTLGGLRRLGIHCLQLLTVPLKGLWTITVGRILTARRERQTQQAVRDLIESAKQGFGIWEESPENQEPPA
jgi:hypothetical protein